MTTTIDHTLDVPVCKSITVKAGARTLVDEVRSGGSYASNNDVRLHFGLGSVTKLDWVQIRWPSGLTERYENLPADNIQTLKEGGGKSMEPEPHGAGFEPPVGRGR